MNCCSDYLETYFSRVYHRGENTAEVAKNSGERSFEKWLTESIHTVKDLSVERGLYFSGIILTDKDKEQQKIMYLNVANDIPIIVGDIVNWPCDGQLEKWIIFKKEKKVNGTYQTFSIVRCNYLIKWVDKLGHLQNSWCYFVSSMDSKIKENFRTWNSLELLATYPVKDMTKAVELLETSNTFLATAKFLKRNKCECDESRKNKKVKICRKATSFIMSNQQPNLKREVQRLSCIESRGKNPEVAAPAFAGEDIVQSEVKNEIRNYLFKF